MVRPLEEPLEHPPVGEEGGQAFYVIFGEA